jgi:hypothetical protein
MQKQFMGVAALGAALAIGDASHAQAVQWRVEDGGNGHWYEVQFEFVTTYDSKITLAASQGGYLGCIADTTENAFVQQLMGPSGVGCRLVLGGRRQCDACPWRWVSDEPWRYLNWGPGEPGNSGAIHVEMFPVSGQWADVNDYDGSCGHYLVEWSADCNNDGIVDYGQCRDGSLPDYNGNNVPDCCETGQACAVGNYPVQWRTSDGGNGSWYRIVNRSGQGAIDWSQSRASAQAIGGDLAVLSTAAENAAFVHLTRGQIRGNPWIGLYQDRSSPDFAEPAGGWRWVNGEPLSWTNWSTGEPNNVGSEDWAIVWLNNGPEGRWNDYQPTVPQGPDGYVIEWSADCNADGIVDYGQILQGHLPDTNGNGVPDSCEVLTCANADLFRDSNINGADLGILLAQWGEANAQTVSDINRDGAVDGVDLGLLLSFWGPCPN